MTAIETQGKKNANQWVKTYQIQYAGSGGIEVYKENGEAKVLTDSYHVGVICHCFAFPVC